MNCCQCPGEVTFREVPRSIVIAPKGLGGFASPMGGGRKRAEAKTLFRNGANGSTAAHTLTSAAFRIRNPSARCRVGVEVTFESDDSSEPALPAAWTWALQVRRINVQTGRSAPLQWAFQNYALPNSWEAETAASEFGGVVSFPAALSGLTTVGNLIVQVTWEPVVEVAEEELSAIYRSCGLILGASSALILRGS